MVALESLRQPHRSTAPWVTAWRGRWRGHAVGHGVAPDMNYRRHSATLVDPDKARIESDHRLGPPRMLHIGLPKGGLGWPQPPKAPAAATVSAPDVAPNAGAPRRRTALSRNGRYGTETAALV